MAWWARQTLSRCAMRNGALPIERRGAQAYGVDCPERQKQGRGDLLSCLGDGE